jgi:hypothetical protein
MQVFDDRFQAVSFMQVFDDPFHAVSFMQVFDDRFQEESGWNARLEAVIKNLQENYQCRMYSRKLLMMGREDARNIWSFITE